MASLMTSLKPQTDNGEPSPTLLGPLDGSAMFVKSRRRMLGLRAISITCLAFFIAAAATTAVFIFFKRNKQELLLHATTLLWPPMLLSPHWLMGSMDTNATMNSRKAEELGVELSQSLFRERESELNNTFYATIQSLNLRIQQLEEEKAQAQPAALESKLEEEKAQAQPTAPVSKVAVEEKLLSELRRQPTDGTGCHTYGDEMKDSLWFPWETGLGYHRFNIKSAIKCLQRLPNKHVVFIGDSILRNVFQLLLKMFKAPKEHSEDLSRKKDHLAQNHLHTMGDINLRFIFATEAKSIVSQLKNFPEALKGDVMFVGTGAWEIRQFPDPNTLFMMSYITRLSADIKYLQDNYAGRVIFVMTPPTSHEVLESRGFRSQRWNSKLQALNHFAERLVRGAGFEVLDVYDFLYTGQGGFIPYKKLTFDGFHPYSENGKVALDLYFNEICREYAFDHSTPANIVRATKGFDGSSCKVGGS